MSIHEAAGKTPASEEELIGLWSLTKAWLDENGVTNLDPESDILGHSDNLPVTNDLLEYRYDATYKAVNTVVPAAAEALNLGGTLAFCRYFPRYEEGEDGLVYVPPFVAFGIHKVVASPEAPAYDMLNIERDDVGKVVSRRIGKLALPPGVTFEEEERDADTLKIVAREALKGDKATDEPMTRLEYRALRDIVENLDDIKQLDTAVPEP